MSFLRRFPCSPVTAGLLIVMAVLSLVNAARISVVSDHLALSPVAVWHGQLWRPLTAPLLARGVLDVVFSGFAFVWICGELERFWKPREWLLYGALCVAVAGFAASAIFHRDTLIIAGPAILIVPLLVARIRLAGAERLQLTSTFSISARAAALLWTVMIVGTALMTGLPLSGMVVLAAAAAAGWAYLTIRWYLLRRQPARAVQANRFGRLEF